MALTYDYNTGKITRDFKFVKYREKCRGSGLPCYVGNDRCLKCKYNSGSIHPWTSLETTLSSLEESYVYCHHPEAKDSPGYMIAQRVLYDKLQVNAMGAL